MEQVTDLVDFLWFTHSKWAMANESGARNEVEQSKVSLARQELYEEKTSRIFGQKKIGANFFIATAWDPARELPETSQSSY